MMLRGDAMGQWAGQLPAETAARSAALAQRIAARIAAAGGWVPFADFMQWALYEPELGYYARHDQAFGPHGDFLTAPEISPLFGAVLADVLASAVAATGLAVEFGAGSGALAEDLLTRWHALGVLPQRYAIVEVSAGLAARQAERLQPLAERLGVELVWWQRLPERFAAAVVANEVLDVLPVHVVGTRGAETFERGVVVAEAGTEAAASAAPRFAWADRPLTPAAASALAGIELPRSADGEYLSEVAPAVPVWVRTVAERLAPGSLWVLIDYGYERDILYAPFRSRGTLQGYYRHRVVEDVLAWPGAIDITAFVDFTAVVTALEASGLTVHEWRRQGDFLLRHGILERLTERAEPGSAAYVQAARAVQRLIMPHEMGELFQVVVAGR
ncbi:class I SAM-dependent methyltransferase [Hydrogenophilus thiooxidans]|uniref:class I SAM-dependent methyltransferase n=1 Tax=Hydrogenophilus thiooxidans TaxID=2820326 RepID=UPI001C21D520|nr:SAM-dependent methyltransferase [Hydrogenophilus thiooxidans]